MADDKSQPPADGISPGGPPAPPGPVSGPIHLNPENRAPALLASPGRSTNATTGPGPGDMKDGTREVIETIVFVVVLVLLLKTFLAEAFVIPTGSMATTLLGYHRALTCEMCGYQFLVNASSEADDDFRQDVTKAFCPNCRYLNVIRRSPPEGVLP
jgi:hypothetical protein